MTGSTPETTYIAPVSPSEPAETPEGETMPPETEAPTEAPEATSEPSAIPTEEPTPEPTPEITPEPTAEPTPEPTPTKEPTKEPTPEPTPTRAPETAKPTATPPRATPADATPYATPDDGSTFDIVINMVGDTMLASYKNEDADNGFKEYANREDPSYFLEKVAPIFRADDLTIANLECVLTDKTLTPIEKNEATPYWYYGKTANTRILTAGSVEAVSLANNHMNDYGDQGRLDTREAVGKAGLLYAGWNETFYFEKNGFKIAVICTNFFSEGKADDICSQVKEVSKNSDFQIVFFHGGKEAEHTPEQWKIGACHSLIDSGADAVIGAHPHVLQRAESYNGGTIVYSLGNFCFGGNRSPENRTVIYRLTVNVKEGDKSFSHKSEIIPFYVYTGSANNYQPAVITDSAEAEKVVEYMKGARNRPY